MTTLTNRALLVHLSISQWTARKLDRQETQAVARKHGIQSDVARVNKALLPASITLDAIHKKTGAIRTDFYKHTLPWAQEGVSILKAEAFFEFSEMMRKHMAEWKALVAQFVEAYPELRENAAMALGGLYKAEDYPSTHQIARKFDIDLMFLPVPDASDWRVQLGDEAEEALRVQIEAQVQRAQGEALADAWRRVYTLVERAHERLAQPDAIFRDSLQENAVELCKLLPQLNLTDDPDLEDMRRRVERALCSHNVSTLREDKTVRSDAARQLEAMMSKMSAMYGVGG